MSSVKGSNRSGSSSGASPAKLGSFTFRALNWLMCTLLVIFSVWSTASALKIGYAAILSDTTQLAKDMEAVSNGDIDADIRLRRGRLTLETAVSLVPSDADVAMEAGTAYFHSALIEQNPETRSQLVEDAIKHYERAVELRSAWPYHYEELLDLYYLTQRPIEQQINMFRGLVAFGKWDRTVKDKILDREGIYIDVLPDDLLLVVDEIAEYIETQSTTESELILEELRSNSNK